MVNKYVRCSCVTFFNKSNVIEDIMLAEEFQKCGIHETIENHFVLVCVNWGFESIHKSAK